jgi:hypothetical protein
MVSQLNEGQRATFDQVMATVNDTNDSVPQQFFFNGPGRTENNVPLQHSHHRTAGTSKGSDRRRLFRHRFYDFN